MKIPKIIHQIWSGVNEPLPTLFKELGETWKEHHPDWQYIQWDNAMMVDFIKKYYPEYWDKYNMFPYNVQRWDAIRYLILNKMGGLYVDFDSECLASHNKLFIGKSCCFSMEPQDHAKRLYGRDYFFNNALMASIPNHPFMEKIIEKVFSSEIGSGFTNLDQKGIEVQVTTGPLTLVRLYEEYIDKDSIYLIPYKYVSPLTQDEVFELRKGNGSDKLEKKLEKAYSIHYFFNTWLWGANYDS